MRKNTARHWLHAILDLLPLLVIPIFAINIINRSPEPISIAVAESSTIDFNQLYNSNTMTSTSNGVDFAFSNDKVQITDTSTNITSSWSVFYQVSVVSGHQYLISAVGDFDASAESNRRVAVIGADWSLRFSLRNDNMYQFYTSDTTILLFGVGTIGGITYNMDFYFQIYDLTSMGLEGISYSQFKDYFPSNFYDFTTSTNVLIDNGLVTYNDTDIGSQFVYSLYHVVDKYFNMGNVFGMNNVYQWFNVNIFGGSAPISIYIVWNIVLYEFVMDLLFLLYGLFMWFIDMLKRLMEKPLDSIK